MKKITKNIYFVLGGPGSGKGTFCENLKKIHPTQINHLSAGFLLRDFIKKYKKINLHDEKNSDKNPENYFLNKKPNYFQEENLKNKNNFQEILKNKEKALTIEKIINEGKIVPVS